MQYYGVRHHRPRRFDAHDQRRENIPDLSAPRRAPRQGRPERNGRDQCQQGGRSEEGIRLSKRIACRGCGDAVPETPGRKALFQPLCRPYRPAADIADSIKGELSFRGKVGKNIEERKDKKDKSYTMFSAFSTEKVDENFEYQWVRFFCFDRQREEWLQPGVKVEAKGEMTVSVHNGKPDISCRVEELTQYIPESDNFNQ